MSTTIQIKHRYTGAVLWTHEASDEREASGLAMRDALEGAAKARANLRGADLSDAYLSGAYLRGAYLRGADLSGADLRGADLSGADLSGADLSGAYLRGAKVFGLALVGSRPLLQIGPIGSEQRTISVWLTDAGVRVQAGCFFGSRDEFAAQVKRTHGDNEHGREYRACLPLIDMHAQLWTPAVEAAA